MSSYKGILVAALVAVLAMASGCTTTTGGSDPKARRASINAGVDDALASLYQQVPGSRELVAQARGVFRRACVIRFLPSLEKLTNRHARISRCDSE